jgi:hypothetical protein
MIYMLMRMAPLALLCCLGSCKAQNMADSESKTNNEFLGSCTQRGTFDSGLGDLLKEGIYSGIEEVQSIDASKPDIEAHQCYETFGNPKNARATRDFCERSVAAFEELYKNTEGSGPSDHRCPGGATVKCKKGNLIYYHYGTTVLGQKVGCEKDEESKNSSGSGPQKADGTTRGKPTSNNKKIRIGEFASFAGLSPKASIESIYGKPNQKIADETDGFFRYEYFSEGLTIQTNRGRIFSLSVQLKAVSRIRRLGITDKKLDLLGLDKQDLASSIREPPVANDFTPEWEFIMDNGETGSVEFWCFGNVCDRVWISW